LSPNPFRRVAKKMTSLRRSILFSTKLPSRALAVSLRVSGERSIVRAIGCWKNQN